MSCPVRTTRSSFQSTLPVGGATLIIPGEDDYSSFNPRSPWEERLLYCIPHA